MPERDDTLRMAAVAGLLAFVHFFGEFLAVLGGSLTQVSMPLIATAAFLRTRQWASAAVTLFWTGGSVSFSPPRRWADCSSRSGR